MVDHSVVERLDKLIQLSDRLDKLDLEGFDQRLRHLEVAHSVQIPAVDSSEITSTTAAQLYEQIDSLGQEYNNLEGLIHKLEVADGENGKRLSQLERLVGERKPDQAQSQHPVQKVDSASAVASKAIPNTGALSTSHTIHSHFNASEPVSVPPQHCAASWSHSLSLVPTHEVAQELVRRLSNGEILSAIVHRQLEATLFNPHHQLLLTPSVTGSKRLATTSKISEKLPALRRRPGRPRKHRLSESSSEEPLRKRPRGRPPKYGRPSLSSSTDSGRPTSSESTYSPRNSTSFMSSENSATAVKHKAPRAASTASRVNRVQTPDKTVEVLETQFDDVEPSSLDSDAPLLSRWRKNRRTTVSTDSDDQNAAPRTDNENNKDAMPITATPPTNAARPTDGSKVTPQPNSSADLDMAMADAFETKSEHFITSIEHLTTPDHSTRLDMKGNYGSEEPPIIPGERRSMRTPKRPTPFGDMLSWNEANQQMQGLKPEAPKKPW